MTHEFHTVKKGTKGIDVTVLQSFFRSSMYVGKDGKPIEVDGDAGENTVFAINTFKKQNQIYNVAGETWNQDGVFDAKCWERLGLGKETSNISVDKIYQWGVNTCNNPNVGYSQAYRNNRTVNGITYYDCSSFVYYALCNAGFNLDPTALPFTTYNMQSILKNLGFTEYNAKDVSWKKSDILWSQEHTEIVHHGTANKGEGYTMGAHGKTNRTLENQVSINTFISNYTKYPKLYRYEG